MFRDLRISSIPWWTKLLLMFCRATHTKDIDGSIATHCIFKTLGDTTYMMSMEQESIFKEAK